MLIIAPILSLLCILHYILFLIYSPQQASKESIIFFLFLFYFLKYYFLKFKVRKLNFIPHLSRRWFSLLMPASSCPSSLLTFISTLDGPFVALDQTSSFSDPCTWVLLGILLSVLFSPVLGNLIHT